MIGQETLDRVRREIGIVELIGQTVRLQKRGRSHVGVCPFHKEKTPSFHVNPEKNFYYCFGCHEAGDAIKFVQRIEGLEGNRIDVRSMNRSERRQIGGDCWAKADTGEISVQSKAVGHGLLRRKAQREYSA